MMTEAEVERLWDNGRDVAVSEDGVTILHDWPGTPFKAGDDKLDVWRWFDARHPRGVHYLLYERGVFGNDRA